MADSLLVGGGRFHRSFFSGAGCWTVQGPRCRENLIRIACSVLLLACEHRGGPDEQASSDYGDSAGRWLARQLSHINPVLTLSLALHGGTRAGGAGVAGLIQGGFAALHRGCLRVDVVR